MFIVVWMSIFLQETWGVNKDKASSGNEIILISIFEINCIVIFLNTRQIFIAFPNTDKRVQNYDVQQSIFGKFPGLWKINVMKYCF